MTKTVYVVAWEYDSGMFGAGFEWYYKAEDADNAFEIQKENCRKFALCNWKACRFTVDIGNRSGMRITQFIDKQLYKLMELAKTRYKCYQLSKVIQEN